MQRIIRRQHPLCLAVLGALILLFGYIMYHGTFQSRDIKMAGDSLSVRAVNKWSQPDVSSIATNETMCRAITNYAEQFMPPLHTDWLLDMNYTKTVSCPVIDINRIPKPRRKVSLDCSGITPHLSISYTSDTRDIYQVNSDDPCLGRFVEHCCTDDNAVQNVAHHVLFGNKEFGFFQFLNFMSVVRFMKPCIHLIHGDYIPSGLYWDFFISNTPNVIHVKSTPPSEVFGHKLAFPEHRADVLRIDVVNKYGGVYTDWDMVLLKPLEPLRQYDCTMSEILEPGYIGCAFIMAKKNSNFLNLWKDGYKEYQKAWGYNSQKVPYLLSKKYPDMIHVEGHRFFDPGMEITFNKNHDVSTNYGLHLAIRYYKDNIDLNAIRKMNVLLGALCRHILLGNKDRCE